MIEKSNLSSYLRIDVKGLIIVIFVTVNIAELTDVSVHAKDIDAAHPFLWDNAWTKMQFISFSFDYVIVVSSNDSQTLDENLLIDRTGHDRRFIEVNISISGW